MVATLKPSPRKTRTKLRKPKFLSLRLQLTATTPPPQPPMPTTNDHKQLINLFPLHPENLVQQDKLDDENEQNMAACIFSSCDDDGAATTLTGILDDDDEEEVEENTNNPSPSSVNYADEEVELVRTAMRRNKTKRDDRNDDDHDEKWVCYSEVVERKKVVTGMTSSSSSSTSCKYNNQNNQSHRSKLALKLDYEKIMKSWVNKGPFCIRGNSDLQTVPDLQDDDFLLPSSITPFHGVAHHDQENNGNGGSWAVPEMTGIENNDTGEGEDVLQGVGSNLLTHNREASVQRYKEKRRNRLFAKTIRYEVRKLNAEKRPRIKGRFVKRN